ncbi:hypothetical protein QE152_g15160 [Popillia japonica]|uniref:CRAL-TRIO domain-containing protein n=1 Tax=Popillia japonica TaxID=7064 RepID=A0AAW1LAM4_POPJA
MSEWASNQSNLQLFIQFTRPNAPLRSKPTRWAAVVSDRESKARASFSQITAAVSRWCHVWCCRCGGRAGDSRRFSNYFYYMHSRINSNYILLCNSIIFQTVCPDILQPWTDNIVPAACADDIQVTIPQDSPTLEITSCLQHVLTIYSEDTKRQGLTVILDARKGPWKIARSCIRQITATMNADELAHFIVLRPENFLDKQRVENCTNTPKDGHVLFIPRSRLNKLVDQSQLPPELGGMFIYNHDLWMENRMKVEEYLVDGASALKNLDDLHQHLMRGRLMRPSEVEITLNNSSDLIDTMKIMSHDTLEKGRLLLEKIESDNRNRKFDSDTDSMLTPQDILDTLEQLETMGSELKKKQSEIDDAWVTMQRNFLNTKDLSLLEDGIVKVTNWILGPAESLLNSKQKVGYDVASAEELRREHEAIELQCWDTYGAYAELVHKVDSFARDESLTLQQKDLISQKDFMDFVCRSFATSFRVL